MDGAGAAEEPRPLPTSLPPLGDNGAGAAVDVGVDGIHPVAGGKGKGRDGERSSQGSQRLGKFYYIYIYCKPKHPLPCTRHCTELSIPALQSD